MQLDLLTSSQGASRASPGASPGSSEARKMTAISGRKCCGSWLSAGPLGCLEKMLLGSSRWASTEFFLTWKPSATPAGRLLFRLVPSMPRISGNASGSWPTPRVGNNGGWGNPERASDPGNCRLEDTAAGAAWPTPQAHDSAMGNPSRVNRHGTEHGGRDLSDWAAAAWATPNAGLHNYHEDPASFQARSHRLEESGSRPLGANLGQQAMRTWPTPQARDHKSGLASRNTMEANARPLSEAAAWATATAGDAKSSGSRNTPGSKAHQGVTLTDMAKGNGSTGRIPNGSGVSSTASTGALSPAFVCYLMGYPEGWLD